MFAYVGLPQNLKDLKLKRCEGNLRLILHSKGGYIGYESKVQDLSCRLHTTFDFVKLVESFVPHPQINFLLA